MGRTALYLIRVHTSLPAEMLDLLDERTGPKGRSEAIREAIKEWLEKPQEKKT